MSCVGSKASLRRAGLGLVLCFLAASPLAGSRLGGAQVERLANGLTVLVLADHTLPMISLQMLYRVGSRSESSGATGLAHFMEHMAFRASENFPETELASRVYAVGGEWHAYTWIDQTTYFETVPAGGASGLANLDLILAIEADRMARLRLPPDEIEAERGAVLTELHGYENDPASVLNDAVVAASFVEHPYRNNVIGWTSDVEHLTHDEVVSFYRRHYSPSNAVLAIAGDVDPQDALARVRQVFGELPAGEVDPLPRTVEPPQQGERRVDLRSAAGENFFQIVYRAPAVTDPDFPAFLLLQAVLGGSPGINFRQDESPCPVAPESRLAGAAPAMATFFAPTAQPFVLSLTGRTVAGTARSGIEREIERRIRRLRSRDIAGSELSRARRDLLSQLDRDEETTADAAHQMAFFAGAGAFDVLTALPQRLAAVTPRDLRRVAGAWLQPWQRTIGWSAASPAPAAPHEPRSVAVPTSPASPAPAASPATDPRVKVLANGVALIVRRVPRIPGGFLRVLAADAETSESKYFSDGGLGQAALRIERDLAKRRSTRTEPPSGDPEIRLQQVLREMVGAGPEGQALHETPAVVVAVGDVEVDEAFAILTRIFGPLPMARTSQAPRLALKATGRVVRLPGKAQSQLGYAVPIDGPRSSEFLAWRLLLYIVAHDYEGRLGKDLIAHRGLLYFIDARVHADRESAWISMTAGVNPERLAATRQRFGELMASLRLQPPTVAEVAEAKAYLIGRRLTAPQSDEDIAAFLGREWMEQERLLSQKEWEDKVRSVTREDVLRLVPRFLAGATAVVDTGSGATPLPRP